MATLRQHCPDCGGLARAQHHRLALAKRNAGSSSGAIREHWRGPPSSTDGAARSKSVRCFREREQTLRSPTRDGTQRSPRGLPLPQPPQRAAGRVASPRERLQARCHSGAPDALPLARNQSRSPLSHRDLHPFTLADHYSIKRDEPTSDDPPIAVAILIASSVSSCGQPAVLAMSDKSASRTERATSLSSGVRTSRAVVIGFWSQHTLMMTPRRGTFPNTGAR